jgi:hypothetical protein
MNRHSIHGYLNLSGFSLALTREHSVSRPFPHPHARAKPYRFGLPIYEPETMAFSFLLVNFGSGVGGTLRILLKSQSANKYVFCKDKGGQDFGGVVTLTDFRRCRTPY